MTESGARGAFDDWIRDEFRVLNTQLEDVYKESRAGRPVSDRQTQPIRTRLLAEGHDLILRILPEDALAGTDGDRLELLGNVGMFMAACSRHGLNQPTARKTSPMVEESRLALRLGQALGVAPRFILATYATRNRARNGVFKSFTEYSDERIFIEFNTRGVFEYETAADALEKISALGVSNPISKEFFREAGTALERVSEINKELYSRIDVETFFFAIRPYYLPCWVGDGLYRGVNAGDFAGINQIDLLLGLCRGDDPFYHRLLEEKRSHVLPHEQEALRRCLVYRSLLDEFLFEAQEHSSASWFRENAEAFLKVCHAHGRATSTHHNRLVQRFIVEPAAPLSAEERRHLTASGPPLDELLTTLEKLRDLRQARKRDDIESRYQDLKTLRTWIRTSKP